MPAARGEADGATLGLGQQARPVEADPAVAPEVAERLAFLGAGGDARQRDVLEICVTSAYVSTVAPSGTPSSARQSRFMVPPPPGTSPTPTSTRPE